MDLKTIKKLKECMLYTLTYNSTLDLGLEL